MSDPSPVLYETRERVARITLNRPERGNGITGALLRELVACVERADLDPSVHAVLLSGNGAGFCGGYDLVDSAEQMGAAAGSGAERGERLADRPGRDLRQPRPLRHLGPDGRLRDDEPQRPGVHDAVPLRQAGRLPGTRLLRGGWHRHGAVLGPARDGRRRQDRLSAGPGVGIADDLAVGSPGGGPAGQAAAVHGRLPVRGGGGRVGPGDRGSPGRSPGGAHRDPARADRPRARSTSSR